MGQARSRRLTTIAGLTLVVVGALPAAGAPVRSAATRDAILIAVGDLGDCESAGDEATARLVDRLPGTVATLGDNAYPDGQPGEFTRCYGPSWGRHKERTRPSPGNHDYHTARAAGYFGYFGRAAGPAGRGYYSYRLGRWHVVSLNSEISTEAGSPQERWLRAELRRNRALCTLAYWHKPQFAGADHELDGDFRALWQALYADRAEVVLNGHEHNYQRFAPMEPSGAVDTARGIREFVVGTGGRGHETFRTPAANTRVSNTDTYGVLRLTLRARSYEWRFVPEAGKTFTDRGSGRCR